MIYGDWLMCQEWVQAWRHKYFPLVMKKDKEEVVQNVAVGVRLMPFGFIELIFPKEYQDVVLTSLNFHQPAPYNLNKNVLGFNPLSLLKRFLKIEDSPKFDTSKRIIFPKYDVSIIPIGVRYDADIVENSGEFVGFTHEGL